jgi:hypothetical protein
MLLRLLQKLLRLLRLLLQLALLDLLLQDAVLFQKLRLHDLLHNLLQHLLLQADRSTRTGRGRHPRPWTLIGPPVHTFPHPTCVRGVVIGLWPVEELSLDDG